MRRKKFLGEEYQFINTIEDKSGFGIVAMDSNDTKVVFGSDKDMNLVFQSKEDAINWWESKDTKYNGEEVFAI